MILEKSKRRKRSILIILLVLILGMCFRNSSLDKALASQAQLVIFNNQVIGEGNDFATQILGLPWDMSSPPYPDYITVFDNFDRGSFSIQDGVWGIDTQQRVPYDPNIWLHSPGIENTQKVLRIGDRFPIDTSVYRLLSIRMCSDISDYMNIYWYLTQLKENSSQIIYHYSQYINIKQGCHLYSIDLEKMPTFVGSWDGMVLGLRLDPGAQGPKAHLEFDWVRLTTLDTTNIVPITWSDVPSGNTITFYLNNTCSLNDAMPIGKINQANTNGTFNWGASAQAVESTRPWLLYALPEAFEPGEYKIVMQIGDQPIPSCPQSNINIRKAPLLTFQKPSMYSGPDYATDQLQDPWGMSNSEDILAVNKITNQVWENGVYSAIAEAIDAYFYPNQEESFDTNKYHYATVRMKVDGTGNNFVSVQRYIWWYTSPAVDVVTTEDMLVREGWHTYSYDLGTALIDSSSLSPKLWTGNPNVFRMDIHEEATSLPFEIDFLTLTGDETILSGQVFPIYYESIDSGDATITFFYDLDRNPSNGRNVIGSASNALNEANTISSNYNVFLPLLESGVSPLPQEVNLLTGDVYFWNTTNVPLGTYFISAEISDGYNTTTWYSEVPVYIQASQ